MVLQNFEDIPGLNLHDTLIIAEAELFFIKNCDDNLESYSCEICHMGKLRSKRTP
jgi:hypothetical protein